MARPKKATVDYFPHMTRHGATVFVLKQRWGNDGYAVWFQLLERLGVSDGLFIDCRQRRELIQLSAYCSVPESLLLEIVDLLADLEAIDRELWHFRIIFCQHLVDNVTDAYRLRRSVFPTREQVCSSCGVYDDKNPVFDVINTERESERESERSIDIGFKVFPPEEKKASSACGYVDNSDNSGCKTPVDAGLQVCISVDNTVDNSFRADNVLILHAQEQLLANRVRFDKTERRGEDENLGLAEMSAVAGVVNAGVG